MAPRERTVCNINLILKLRLCFGCYTHIFESTRKRCVVKILLVAFSCYVAFLGFTAKECKFGVFEYYFYVLARSAEHLAYVVCAAQTEDQYIIEYFAVDLLIDKRNYKNVYRKIPKILFTYLVLIFLGFAPYYLSGFFFKLPSCDVSILRLFQMLYLRVGTQVGCLPPIMIFLLLYCRVEVFCKRVRDEVIKNPSTFQWRKYLYIYVEVKNALRKTDWPLKFMIFLQTLSGFAKVSFMQFNLFKIYTKAAHTDNDMIIMASTTYCVVFTYMLIFLPSIILELVIAQLESLRTEIADSMITCTDENRRQNLFELLKCLREQPFKYTLWRAVEVNARLPLAFLSVSITVLVCMLQLSHLLD